MIMEETNQLQEFGEQTEQSSTLEKLCYNLFSSTRSKFGYRRKQFCNRGLYRPGQSPNIWWPYTGRPARCLQLE